MKQIGERYVALDVLRGITIAGMILVNNPGSWGSIFPPLRHATWHGATPTDLVFPFFLCIVGAAFYFSLTKREARLVELTEPTSKELHKGESLEKRVQQFHREQNWKIVKRAATIFAAGLLLHGYPFFHITIDQLRIFGVLQRIALSYLLGALLIVALRNYKKVLIAGIALTLLHSALLILFGGEAPFSLEGNFANKIDLALLGESHLYKGFGIPFDPEGLLGTLSGASTLIFGYLVANEITKSKTKEESVAKLYTIGLLALLAGVVCSIAIPINKPLWTTSYVFYTGGWATITLAFLIYLIDIKGRERPFYIFKALGHNPLFIFLLSGVVAKTLTYIVRWESITGRVVTGARWLYLNGPVALLGDNEWSSLLYALLYVLTFSLIAHSLYKRKIIIKI